MEIRLRADGAVMLEDQFRRWAKETTGASWNQTTDEVLEALGADVVFEGPQPMAGRYQIVYRDGVEQVDGKWYTKYSVADLDADAIVAKDAEQAKAVRADRNQKLKDSDWSQVADAPVDKAVWAAYRQALRDVPSQAGFPWEVTWPTTP
jgi:hypothetical protein